MNDTIRIRAGKTATMPTLGDRELVYSKDENALYIGDGLGGKKRIGGGGGVDIKTFDLEAMGLPMHYIGEGYVEVATDTTEIVSALREGIARFEFMTNLGKVSAVCNQIYADGVGAWCVISSFYNESTYGDFVIVVGEGFVTLLSNIRINQALVEYWISQSEYRIKAEVEAMISDALGAVENGTY